MNRFGPTNIPQHFTTSQRLGLFWHGDGFGSFGDTVLDHHDQEILSQIVQTKRYLSWLVPNILSRPKDTRSRFENISFTPALEISTSVVRPSPECRQVKNHYRYLPVDIRRRIVQCPIRLRNSCLPTADQLPEVLSQTFRWFANNQQNGRNATIRPQTTNIS